MMQRLHSSGPSAVSLPLRDPGRRGTDQCCRGAMKNIALSLATVIALSGCASASKTYGPDGKEAYSLNCSGWARTWGMCYEKAGDLCGTKGYEVIGQGSDQGAIASVNQTGGFAGSTILLSPVCRRHLGHERTSGRAVGGNECVPSPTERGSGGIRLSVMASC